MKRKSFKNKILILFSFLFILIGTFTISSFAYHEDDNGNLVSDNLINNSPSVFESGTLSTQVGTSFNNSKVSNNARFRTKKLFNLDSSLTYSISVPLPYQVVVLPYENDILQTYDGTQFNSALSSLSFSGVKQVAFILKKSDNSVFSSINDISNIDLMFNEGNVKSFEPYGQTFYSHDTLNKISRYNYGPYSYATNIKLTYNNGSSSFVYKNYSNIYDLTLEPFIGFGNQCIVVNDYKFIFAILGGNANWTYTLNFTFANNSIKVSDFNEWYFYGPVSYSFTSGTTNFSQTSSGNPAIISLTDHNFSSSSYITNFSFTRKNPYYGGLTSTKVGTPNSTLGYDNGYINGFDDATSQITESYSTIIKQYESTIKTLSDRVSYLENANRNYTNLIWTIGATPWESFKHIWNVEFAGINIANIVTGLVTALLIIYLIKKVWK